MHTAPAGDEGNPGPTRGARRKPFSLVASYPRRLFSEGQHAGLTVGEAGLAPDASLFVEEVVQTAANLRSATARVDVRCGCGRGYGLTMRGHGDAQGEWEDASLQRLASSPI